MDSAVEFERILGAYCACPGRLRAVLAGLAESDFDLAPDEQNWSIRQMVQHVVDGDDLWQVGLLAALGNPPGFDLAWYWSIPQQEWAEIWAYAARPVEPALEFFEANRQRAAQILQRIPGALERQMMVRWPGERVGQISVREILEMQTRHVEGHIADIQAIRAAHGR